MKRTTFVPLMVILVVISFLGTNINRPCWADDVSLGRQAEQTGKLRQALTHYVEALKADDTNQQLREKIIKLAQKIQPPPEVPEGVYRHMARGEAFIESANDKAGYILATKEFQAATNAAPWSADAYYNLGVSQDKAGLYVEAMDSLNLYLLAAPNASDAREVRNLIYKIEVRKEEQRSKVAEPVKTVLKYPKPIDIEGEWWGAGSWDSESADIKKYWISAIGREIEIDFNPYHTSKCNKPCQTLYLKGYDLVGSQRTHGGYFSMPSNATILCSGPEVYNNIEIKGTIDESLQTITLQWKQPFLTYGCRKVYKDYKLVLSR